MSTLHGAFEGFFVGLPSPDVDARGVARFHDLQLDWGTLRPATLVDAPPERPADPTPVHWAVLGPILAELEDGNWYRLWLHDARLHWGRPRLARDDGDRSLWCVKGHLVGRLATGAVAEPQGLVPLRGLAPSRPFAWASREGLAPGWPRLGCLPLLVLAALALAVLRLAWPLAALLALLAAGSAWRARARAFSSPLGWGANELRPDASWLLPLALGWLLLHWLFVPCRAIPALLWWMLVGGAFVAANRAERLDGLLIVLALALPLALIGWQRTACQPPAPATAPASSRAPGVAVPGSGISAPPGPATGGRDATPAPPGAAPSGDPVPDGAGEASGEGGASRGGAGAAGARGPGATADDPGGPGAPGGAGEWPSRPSPDRDAELVQSASRGPARRIGLDAALAQGRLECGQTIHMSGDLLFPIDSATLRPQSLEQLRKLHRVVQASPDVRVKLVGHADETGLREHNDALSRERARAVGDWLLRWQALPPERLDLEGHGEAEPLVRAEPGSPLQRLNRRVEVVVSCPGGGDAGE
ncbi:MAG: OmpA family protein [Alphaproteobacteria bacterium]